MGLLRSKPLPGSVPALFLHIQKTAGTSILHLVRHYYGDSVVSHGDCWGRSPEQLSNVRFVSGHIGYDFARHLMPGRYSFTFLRDPTARILSMYYFCRARNPAEFDIYRKAQELSLPDFLEAGLHDPCVRKNIWNNQVWQLAHGYAHLDKRSLSDFGHDELLRMAKDNLASFSHVGLTERFHQDSIPVLRALGLPMTSAMPRMNATEGRPGLLEHSPVIRRKLDKLTELDRELYQFARRLGKQGPKWWSR
jgi:hypothetical protein